MKDLAKHVIQFVPVLKERIWGSDDPNDFFGHALPNESTFGELWDVVDRSDAQSMVFTDVGTCVPLQELLADHGLHIMGPRWCEGMRFPLLIKRLICRKTLSVQVHPPHDIAVRYGGEKKDEMWYILNACKDAKIYAGLIGGMTREQFEKALFNGTLTHTLHSVSTHAGDAIFIPSGRVHAIGSGNTILEIQESSDTTYRVYDWDRVGLDGKPRALHINESLDSIDYSDYEPYMVHILDERGIIARCDAFHVQQYRMTSHTDRLYFGAGAQPRLLHVVYGSVLVNDVTVRYGETVLLSYGGNFVVEPRGISVVLITDHFFV